MEKYIPTAIIIREQNAAPAKWITVKGYYTIDDAHAAIERVKLKYETLCAKIEKYNFDTGLTSIVYYEDFVNTVGYNNYWSKVKEDKVKKLVLKR